MELPDDGQKQRTIKKITKCGSNETNIGCSEKEYMGS